MDELERKKLVNFGCVVPVSPHVPIYDRLDPTALKVGPGQAAWVEQDLPNVV
jgi:hypothetical protein